MTSQLKRNNYENNYTFDDEKKFYDKYHKYAWSYAKNYIEYENINNTLNYFTHSKFIGSNAFLQSILKFKKHLFRAKI